MPKDNIERAIKKAVGADAVNYIEVSFEGYAQSGIAVFVECLTDNNNRTVASVRSIFNKYGGNLGTNGSLNFLFNRNGVFTIKSEGLDLESLALEMIDTGIDEFEVDDDILTITCAMELFGAVNKKLDELGIEVEEAALERVPIDTKTIDLESAKKVMKFIEALEDDDDVQNVYHNLEITDELAEALENE